MDKKFLMKFTGHWIINALVLSFASSSFPGNVVLGNAYLGTPTAGIFSAFLLTVLLLVAKGLARTKGFNIKGRSGMFLYYWASASAGIWLVARVSTVSGFGISRFTWAIGIGLVVSLTSWILRQAFKGMKIS